MRRSVSPRVSGAPLATLALVLVGWISLRVFLWEPLSPAVAQPEPADRIADSPIAIFQPVEAGSIGIDTQRQAEAAERPALRAIPPAPRPQGNWIERPQVSVQPVSAGAKFDAMQFQSGPGLRRTPDSAHQVIRQTTSIASPLSGGGRDLKLLEAEADTAASPNPAFFAPQAQADFAVKPPRRWSFDGWLMWRDEERGPVLSGRPSYGRSQAGIVSRFDLARQSRFRPQLQGRFTAALAGEREREAALGASARLARSVPVRIVTEARLTETDRGEELRGAAFAVSELPLIDLPGGLVGEAYAQAGYVSGHYSTAFIDGQVRAMREFFRKGPARLAVGGGAWGGAQSDANRLDVGPSAALSVRVGDINARVMADYRVRVAGGAEPSSGPAVTVAAGF